MATLKSTFPGHYKPEDKQLEEIWKDCLFVFDTSTLLNLYRYPEVAREDLLGVMKQISNRAWIPHQVALEYQENRLGVILDQIEKYDEVLGVLKSTKNNLEGELLGGLQLGRRHQLINANDLLQKVQQIFDEFSQNLAALRKQQPNISDKDEIRGELDKIFDGHIGAPPQSQDELDKIYEEGKARYDKSIPPGYKDRDTKAKPGEKEAHIHNGLVFRRLYGDLIVWMQLITEVKARQAKHVIFITDDEKEDWWKILDASSSGKKTVGPRTELVEEISSKAAVEVFYMYNSERFLQFAKQYLNASINQETIKQVALFATSEESLPRALEQILAVVQEVLYNQRDYMEAVRVVAEQKNLWWTTVADKCTRQIGIDAATFRSLLKNKQELIKHLTDHFPDYSDRIVKSLP